ncbi:unnamed protein product [Boreogadus saida]
MIDLFNFHHELRVSGHGIFADKLSTHYPAGEQFYCPLEDFHLMSCMTCLKLYSITLTPRTTHKVPLTQCKWKILTSSN